MAFTDIFKRKAEPKPVRRFTEVPFIPLVGGKGTEFVGSTSLAMKISTAYRCIDILSKGVAQLPLEVKKNRGGFYTTDEKNGLNYLLSVKPNERQTSFEFMRNLMIQVVCQGNAYILPADKDLNRAATWKDIRQFILFSTGSVFYDVNGRKYNVSDTINGINRTFSEGELIHVRNLGTDGGYKGLSTISYAGRILAVSNNADEYSVDNLRNGGVVKGFVSGNGGGTLGFGAVQDSQLDDVASNIEKQIASGRDIFSLPGEMKFNALALSPNDIKLMETKQFNVLEICRFFGVHPDKVFAQQSSNYKASEMSQVAFLTDTLQPYLRQIELEFQTKLFGFEDYGKYRIDFNIDSLMQTDLNTQASYMEKTIATGTRTVNSWRKHFGQEPVEGGDVALVSANLVPINSQKLYGEKEN